MTDEKGLREALDAVARGDGDRRELARLLADARVYVLGSREKPPAAPSAEGEAEEGFRMILHNVGGRPTLAVFTSQAALEAQSGMGQRWLALPASAAMAACPPGADVVIDPGTAAALRLRPDEVTEVAGGSPGDAEPTSSVAARGDKVFLGLPAQRPDGLLAALADHLDTEPAVSRAYSAQIFRRSDGQPPHPLVGIEVDAGSDVRRVMEGAAAVAGRHSEAPVDVFALDGGSLTDWMLANGERFFER